MKKKINPQAMQIAACLHDWLEHHVPSIKACSRHTLRNYHVSMTLYAEFLRTVKGITPETLNADCFCKKNIEEWIVWMKKVRNCSPATCNVRLSALRAFLKYLSDNDISFVSVFLQAENVPNEKTPKRKVIGLSKLAVDTLLSMPNQRTAIGFRDYTLLLLLYSTAVRINELLTLKICNITMDCAKPHIIVIGKGRKRRPIPLLAKPVQYLKKYLTEYHPNPGDAEALLFSSKSRGIYTPMSAENVNKMLKRYAKMAHGKCSDVPLDIHAHQFRHAKASHWLENGMNIAVNYAGSAEAAEQTAADCRALGVQAVVLQADVRRPEACKQLVEDAAAAFGRLDVLVNNAGVTADKLLLQMTEADFDAVIETNLKGAFFCTKTAARLMMRQRYGRIISVSSVVGLHGNAGQANYAASKAGLIGLTKSAAKEYAARNITANVVAPGFIATDMTAVLSEPARAAAQAAIPAGKIGHAEDVAAAVAFLAGEQAGYITGQVLCVDGGMGM